MAKLYDGERSSASYRLRIALNLKRIAHERHTLNLLAGEQRAPDYLAFAPAGLVPAWVEDDGTAFGQSLATIEYLDATHPEPRLVPQDPRRAALVREIALAISCDIHPLNNLRVLRYLKRQLGQDDAARDEWYRHWVREGLRAVEATRRLHGEAGRFCVGDAVTMADLCLVPQLYNARRYAVDTAAEFPALDAIDKACLAMPAFADAAPKS